MRAGQVTTLGQVGKWGSGGTPKSTESSYYGGRIPWVRSGDLPDGRILEHYVSITKEGLSNSSAKLVPEGTILIAIYGATIGKLGITTYPVTTNQAVAYCVPDNDLTSSEFLFWYLLGARPELIASAQGGAQPNISQTILKARSLVLPSQAEQRRIVAKLDRLFAHSKIIREELARIPQLVERYKQAILASAFRGDLTSDWRESNSGRLEDWQTSCIGNIADVGTGATPKRGTSRFYHNGTIPWVTSGAVNEDTVDAAEEMITQVALKETNCKIFAPGTLLIAMYGEGQTRGKVSILKIHAATNQALAAIRIREPERVSSKFLFWFLRANYLELRRQAAGGVQPNLNLGMIKATALSLPPEEEQEEIVSRIEQLLQRVDSISRDALLPSKLLDRLEQATLTRAFRGELV